MNFKKIVRQFAVLHDSNYRATSRKVGLGPGSEIQVCARLFCLEIRPPGTQMCRLKHAARHFPRELQMFGRGVHSGMVNTKKPRVLAQNVRKNPQLQCTKATQKLYQKLPRGRGGGTFGGFYWGFFWFFLVQSGRFSDTFEGGTELLVICNSFRRRGQISCVIDQNACC